MMLIRTIALLSVAACGFTSDPTPPEPTTAGVDQAVINTCNPRNYPCDPHDPFANGVCQIICEGNGSGNGHCMPYTAVEDAYCAAHPDHFISASKYCDYLGDPTWDTHCAPGWLP